MNRNRAAVPVAWLIILPLVMAGIVLPFLASMSAEAAPGACANDPAPTSAVKWFNNRGIDQPENWINQPSAYFFNGFTYVAWQAGLGFVPCVQRYDHATGEWSNPVQVAPSNPIAGDGHGAPAIFITPGGKIHVAYGAHLTPLKYARGDVTNFEGGWETRPNITGVATYPHFVYAGDPAKLWVVYRSGDACGAWSIRQSTNEGTSWSSEGNIIDLVAGGAYVGGVTAGADGFGIYLHWVLVPNATCATDTNNRTGSYLAYYLPDNGNQFWCKSTLGDIVIGFLIEIPPPACLIEATVVSNFGMVRKLGAAIAGDSVFVMYSKADIAPIGAWQYRFASYSDAAGWTIQTVAYGDHFQDYQDFRMLSATSAEAYLIANATDGTGSKEGGIINRWTWNGAVWTNAETVLTPAQSGGRLLSAPFIPINAHANATVFFNERIISLTDPTAKMYLFGAGGFLPSALAPVIGTSCFDSAFGGTVTFLLPFLIGASILLVILGAWITSRSQGRTNVGGVVPIIVGLIVILFIAAAMLGAIPAC